MVKIANAIPHRSPGGGLDPSKRLSRRPAEQEGG